MFHSNDIQILRTAALEIQADSSDLVSVAGVIKRIKNWFKAKFDPEFKDKIEKLEDAYDSIKGPIGTLNFELNELDKAIQDQDIEAVTNLVGKVPGTISSVTKDMERLRSVIQNADRAIPIAYVDSITGKQLSTSDLLQVTQDYKKNKELVKGILDKLPEEIKSEIPIGETINQPITNLSWYKRYSPDNFSLNPRTEQLTKQLLINSFKIVGLYNEKIEKIIEDGFERFVENLKFAIVERSIVIRVDLPDVSSRVAYRSTDQLWVTLTVPDVPFPWLDGTVLIHVGKVVLTDLLSRTELSFKKINEFRINPSSRKIILESLKAIETESKSVEPIIASDGPITKLVKKAIINNKLPLIQADIKISGGNVEDQKAFAKILTKTLRTTIGSVNYTDINEDHINVKTATRGSEILVLNTIFGIASDITNQFNKNINIKVGKTNNTSMIKKTSEDKSLSYSAIMRDLRKGDLSKQLKFQKVFKDSFEHALFEDMDEPVDYALQKAVESIDFEGSDA